MHLPSLLKPWMGGWVFVGEEVDVLELGQAMLRTGVAASECKGCDGESDT